MSEVLRKTLPLPVSRSSKIETNGSKMESQVELRRKRRNPRWNSAGNQWIQDRIPDGSQMEAKGSKMGSKMELSWKPRNPRWSSDGSDEAKIDSQDRNQVIPSSNPSNPRANPRHIKKTGHNWSVFKIYRELNDYSATTSNEKVPFTFL